MIRIVGVPFEFGLIPSTGRLRRELVDRSLLQCATDCLQIVENTSVTGLDAGYYSPSRPTLNGGDFHIELRREFFGSQKIKRFNHDRSLK